MPMSLEAFQSSLRTSRTVEALSAGLIGEGAEIEGAFGPRRITYADYTASGRALRQVEEFILAEVLPYYANSHTEASYCGARMTTLRREARAQIARSTGADENYTVIFTGSGATAGINRALSLFGFGGAGQEGGRPAVLIGPYEHHSNILPWRESGAEVIEIPEAPVGGPDMDVLEAELLRLRDRPLVLGAFSAASNVTG
ncbi:MAG: aminotransferase class V-fold PLP-dependent enzyme, partial [Pannonibacter indicus]